MGPEDRRGGRGSADDELEGRDLLVGRAQGAEVKPGAGTEQSPAAATSSQPGAHVENIREILETVRATAAKIDALEFASGSGPENETGDALARETAALANERTALARETAALTGARTALADERAALAGERAALAQALKAARGSLAKAEALAARWEEKASSEASVLSQDIAALKQENAALGTYVGEAHKLANKVSEQMHTAMSERKAVYDSKIDFQETAKGMADTLRGHAESLGVHAENMLRINRNHRLRPLRIGVAFGAASFVFFLLGTVLQAEVDVLSLGDEYREWNDHVLEHYGPTLALCAMRATSAETTGRCPMDIEPVPEITIPFSYPELR